MATSHLNRPIVEHWSMFWKIPKHLLLFNKQGPFKYKYSILMVALAGTGLQDYIFFKEARCPGFVPYLV